MQLEDFLPNICINLSNTKGIKDCENVPDQNKFKTRETKASTTKVIIDCETKKSSMVMQNVLIFIMML